jgi:prolipoprotein diacylglyceryl transferase
MLAYLPSPPANGISIGPFRLHLYGLLIACGVAAAIWMAQKRWELIGGARGTMASLALWGVPGGLAGARIYSIATSWQQDTGGHWYRAFAIWEGGLGIWGGIAGGVILGLVGARRRKLPMAPLLDSVAPALPLAQAIGRWGNYFNGELYGRPTHLPWAVKITRNPAVPGVTTYQPTFLYECVWDLAVVGVLLWAAGRFRIKRGYLFALYVALYTAGRFWTEYLRIDPAHRFGGLRLNDWTSLLVFLAASTLFVLRGRARPGEEAVSDPLSSAPGADPEERGGEPSAVQPSRGPT